MATQTLQVITEYCEGYMDDMRISAYRQACPALYLRQMYFFLRIAISLFNKPKEMQKYLLGTQDNPKLVEPVFADTIVSLSEDVTGSYTFVLGEEYANYDLASVRERVTNADGTVVHYAVDFTYDVQIGNITVNGDYASGTVFELDFANDGYFVNDLSPEMMDILGCASGLAWRERFNAEWLTIVAKVEDKSFKEQNRATDKRANTEQIGEMRKALYSKMRTFEQSQWYKATVPQGSLNIYY